VLENNVKEGCRSRSSSGGKSMRITVRNMTPKEVSLAIEWAAAEGWNPGLHDAECFYAADPQGFFLAEADGQPAGCLSAVAYDEHFGFAGFYIVLPQFRNLGIGHELVRTASAYAGSRSMGNDAVVAQQETYRQLGFRLAYRNIRYRGKASSKAGQAPEIIDLRKIPFGDLVVYDRAMFPAERPVFLQHWINQPEATALGCEDNGKLAGYGVIRKCRRGYKIGPLFADREEIAETLFLALTGRIPGEEFFLDIPEPNAAAGSLVRRHNMQSVFETARMYSGAVPSLPLERIFGVTSFELG
jgi:GNAT superfamily N-acetyltransferase